MAPCGDSSSCPDYAADGPYRYALEVPKGRLPALGVTDGRHAARWAAVRAGERLRPAGAARTCHTPAVA